jgi:hypothetical protein
MLSKSADFSAFLGLTNRAQPPQPGLPEEIMSERRLTGLNDLVRTTEIVNLVQPDHRDLIAQFIRHMARDGSDPLHSRGVLVEGTAHLLSASVPPDRRDEAAQSVTTVFRDCPAVHDLV